MTESGDQIADVNDDGRPDKIANPQGDSQLTITFSVGSAHETTVGPRDLADRPAHRQPVVLAAVADFNRDGWEDLFVTAGQGQAGDDSTDLRMAEVRLGPFSDTGRGQKVLPLQPRATKYVAVADSNHDRYPDLEAGTHTGDGYYYTLASFGDPVHGLQNSAVAVAEMGDGSPAVPLHARLAPFYPPCAGNYATG